MIKQVFLAVSLLLIAAIRVYGDFSKLESFLENENLWQTTPDSFLANSQDQIFFRWLSSKNDAARYPGYRDSPQMTFLEKKCWEVVVKFDAGNLAEVTISLYNRGDAGDIDDKAKYLEMFKDISEDIEKWVGEKGVVLPEQWLANGKKLKKTVWVKNNNLVIEIRWSASEHIQVADPQHPGTIKSKFRAEYIQLIVTPLDPQNDPRKNRTSSTSTATATIGKAASATDIKDNVKKDEDGYVYIANIPMVDQGQKGYCAVATAQRILEYYGADIDQHVIAQVANTSTSGGTSPKEMIEMLKKIGFKFGVRVKIHTDFDVQKFIAFVNDYNNAARKRKRKEITIGHVIDVAGVYRTMDPEILKNVRCDKNKAGVRDFAADIIKHVDSGIPLEWSVMLGIVPENPKLPQAFGGHMRIILGYNKDKNDIVYSDSWGAEHEKKLMSMEDAWTITTGLYSIDPRK